MSLASGVALFFCLRAGAKKFVVEGFACCNIRETFGSKFGGAARTKSERTERRAPWTNVRNA
jgi:hypothetical protein